MSTAHPTDDPEDCALAKKAIAALQLRDVEWYVNGQPSALDITNDHHAALLCRFALPASVTAHQQLDLSWVASYVNGPIIVQPSLSFDCPGSAVANAIVEGLRRQHATIPAHKAHNPETA